MDLIRADSENEVKRIIDSHPLLSSPEYWKSYGPQAAWGTFFNQQESPVAALTEKIINSIDALLMKECALRGIDPTDGSAPRTMRAAVEAFYGIKRGDYSELGESDRRELASNIWVIAEGSKKEPSLIVADRGEGQHPDDFGETLVAIHRTAKRDIHFVQGRYHMGATGALLYCGEYNYQLILSRKHPDLLQPRQLDRWGFTLVRLHSLGPGDRTSYYEYCVDVDGNVFSFPGKDLAILPEGEVLGWGTYIKMYNYDLPHPSNITLDLWRGLNRMLHQPALPVLLYEGRAFSGKVRSKVLLGNRMRLAIDERESVERNFPIAITAKLGRFGRRSIEVTVLKEGTRKSEFASQNEAVFFTINGQTHASLGRSFLKSRTKLGYLADYMLVHVDCTDVDTNVMLRTFSASRDRMKDNEIAREVQTILAEELRKHEGLRELENFRREQQIMKNPKDTKFMEAVVERLIKRNRLLTSYLGLGGRIKAGIEPGRVPIEEYDGRRFPTFLRLRGTEAVKRIPVNSYVWLRLETDACNDYLSRDIDPGKLMISPDIAGSYRLWNGVITIKLVPPEGAKVGERHRLAAELKRPYDDSLFVGIDIEYAPPIEKGTQPGGKPKPPSGQSYHLPEPILVYREPRDGYKTWADMDPPWTGGDVARVIPSGEEDIDIYINMDTDALHSYLRLEKRSDEKIDQIKRLYEVSMFLHALVFYNDLAEMEEVDEDELLPEIMKSVAKISLDLIDRDVADES
jgi:hypothetical protein